MCCTIFTTSKVDDLRICLINDGNPIFDFDLNELHRTKVLLAVNQSLIWYTLLRLKKWQLYWFKNLFGYFLDAQIRIWIFVCILPDLPFLSNIFLRVKYGVLHYLP